MNLRLADNADIVIPVTITIHEIYRSIQGESTFAGRPCTFVRTTACDLRCRWCDTEHAFYEGKPMTLDNVLTEVKRLGADLAELTGGEPLLQKETPELCRRLLAMGTTVLIETGGHRDIAVLPDGVIRIMDLKCPGSGMADKNLWSNIEHLNRRDEVKFVIAGRADFDWAVEQTKLHYLCERVNAVLFSPVFGECDPAALAQWVVESGLDIRMQLQMHKHIWAPDARGV
ncbi:MAG: 7-carboxy-7-deazaguanine synthase QueE [Planctomycetes bacterium]|nr:7-carboxy-7-deazaguanine synthase QueE [Planctomycetota bacterium]NUQ34622.1 radical SAM protein [Planctomycetaceae bacterium]